MDSGNDEYDIDESKGIILELLVEICYNCLIRGTNHLGDGRLLNLGGRHENEI